MSRRPRNSRLDAASTHRRGFLQASALTGVGFWVAGGVQARASRAANEQIQFGCIGIGGKGSSDSGDAKKHGQVVAICDIDEQRLEAAAKAKFPGSKAFYDYRELYDQMGDQIDAVTVSTPDHHHAPAAAKALRLKKHCFCQKPLTHSIYEARKLGELARAAGVATQMGNQGTANAGLRRAAAIIREGGLGTVKEVHVWTNRPVWPQGGNRPKSETPDKVRWDLFLGPAPLRPFGKGYHPFVWRGWWDFGTGALGDMACHTFNMPFHALNLRDPLTVQAKTSGHNGDTYPKWSEITFEFGPNGDRGPLKFYWYDGGKKPNPDRIAGKNPDKTGAAVVGDKGVLYSPNDYGAKFEIIGTDEPDVDYVQSPGHFQEWIDAIRGGPPAMSNFADYAGPLSETILLGNLAVWAAPQPPEEQQSEAGEVSSEPILGKKVEWDAKRMVATNAPELAGIVRREYRGDYEL